MLSKKQKLLMKVIYSHAIRKEGVCLIRPIDLLKEIPLSSDFRRDELESNLKALVTEDFFEMITTDKKGEEYYCFTLHQNGYAFSFRHIFMLAAVYGAEAQLKLKLKRKSFFRWGGWRKS